MKETFNLIDKSDFQRGDWDSEPDQIEWTDEQTGYPCLMWRNRVGAWCGYVGITKSHPWFELDYGSLPHDIDVHCGLTYSGNRRDHPKDLWWFGFDCGHLGDVVPALSSASSYQESYKRSHYVRRNVESLAAQLKGMA